MRAGLAVAAPCPILLFFRKCDVTTGHLWSFIPENDFMSTATMSNGLVEPVMQEFEAIFREHSDLVFGTACSIMRRGDDAEDVVQTVFIRLLRSGMPPEFRRNPKGYLYRAAINQSLTVLRDRRRHPTTDLGMVTAAESPAETNSKEEIQRKLHDAIAELRPQSAEIVILRYMHNRSDSDIANLLGKSRVTIAVRLHRARAELKRLLRASLGEEL
jgi:RNA polymerase sigma-70 factor (ECF subfamily)